MGRMSPGSATAIQTGDIQIGAVEIKDQDSAVRADVKDLTNSDALVVAVVDSSGNQVSDFGVVAQYTEGDIDASITGVAMMVEGAGNALVAAPGTAADGLTVNLGTNNDVTVASLPLPSGASTEATLVTIDADTSNMATSLGNLDNSVDGNYLNVNMNVAGTDVAGGAGIITAQTPRVTIATDDEVNNLLGTIDADTSTLAGAVAGSEMQVDVVSSALPSGAATAAKQPALGTAGTPSTDVISVQGIASMTALKVDGSAVTQPVSAASLPLPSGAATAANQLADGHNVTVDNAAGVAAVNIQDGGNAITVDGTVAVTQSGTWDEVGINDSGNNISVDWGGTVPPIGAGTEAAALRVTVATDSTGVLSVDDNGGALTVDGTVTVGSITAGDNNIGNVDIASAIPAGTNAIGKLLPPDIDVTTHTNYAKKYYTNAGAVTDGIIWSPGAGKRWHVVSMYIQTSAAATVTLEDDLAAGDSAVWKGEFAANEGMTINFSEKYPLASGEDAADLLVTTSAGNIYITITGYEI